MKGTGYFLIFLAILSLIGTIFFLGKTIYINYLYEKEIGSYFDNAKDCITPDCILIQLDKGYEAINNSGLTKEDYGAIWFKKPTNSMEFQYQHLDAIIERANAVQDWVNKVYSNQSSGETMKDVYTEKMDNLRSYVTGETVGVGGRSDWISKTSWYVKYHRTFYSPFAVLIGVGLIILTVSLFIIGGILIEEG